MKMMGCSFNGKKGTALEASTVSLDMFMTNEVSEIGVGGFGKVCTAMFVKDHAWYAIKDINKVFNDIIIPCLELAFLIFRFVIYIKSNIMKHKNGVSMIFSELDAFKKIDYHPFIVGLHFAFQDRYL